MIIGHLPAGYIVSSLLANKLVKKKGDLHLLVLVGVIGAIVPDLDIFYFYFVDNRQHHHHTYWPHYPIIWISLLLISIIWYWSVTNKSTALLALFFSANGVIHMVLDSIVGDIWWFAPFIDQSYAIFSVPALYNPWWLNFILHWSFMLELCVLFWALLLWRQKTE